MDLFGMFGEALKLITNWAAFVTYVKTAVIAAETDTKATGQEKLDAVVAAVISGMKNDFNIDLTGLEPMIVSVVNAIVSVFNSLGIFTHKTVNSTAK